MQSVSGKQWWRSSKNKYTVNKTYFILSLCTCYSKIQNIKLL